MRACNQHKKAERSVRNRQIKRRMQIRKLNKRHSKENESTNARVSRVDKLLNEIRKGKVVWLWKQLALKESESVCTYPIFWIKKAIHSRTAFCFIKYLIKQFPKSFT